MLSLLVGAVLVVSIMRVPYVVLSPGSARSVVPLVTVSQKPGGPEVTEDAASDDLLYVTVTSSVRSVTISPSVVSSFVGDEDQLVADVVTDGPISRTVTW